jgi:lipopolysaccharide biosynthesis glycosyltransferase
MNIPIFLSADDNYAPFVAATVASICDNTNSFADFYILDTGISEENKRKIENLKDKFSNFSVEFLYVDTNKYFEDIDYKNREKYISIATYNRFLIPKLKSELSKVIYLDADIIVNLDISELYNIELEDYELGAVSDSWCNGRLRDIDYKNCIFKYGHCYFNAGVLLINNKKWLERDIQKTIINLENEYRNSMQFADQDLLNILYNGSNYKIIDKKYNMINFIDNMTSDKCICHYAGNIKPWQIHPDIKTDIRNPMLRNKELFWNYARKTDFYDKLISECTYKDSISLRKYLVYELLRQKMQNNKSERKAV